MEAVDLQAGLNVAEAAMSNYAAVAVRAAHWLPRPVAVCGWSMGGLVAMLAARQARAALVVLLEPSPPAEVQGIRDNIRPEPGTFDPEAEYGPFPAEVQARPESRLARDERRRGVPVPVLPCPAAVVYGDEFPDARGRDVARVYGADERALPGLDHWGLVLDSRARDTVADLLAGEESYASAQ